MAKMTKKEMFAVLSVVVANSTFEGVEVDKDEVLAFINHEVELLNKKSSKSGQTKTQKENAEIIEKVFEALGEVSKPVTITELQTEVPAMAEYSNQKLSALMKKLVDANRVVKTVDKKKSYFSIED